jgi:hypothetical protein
MIDWQHIYRLDHWPEDRLPCVVATAATHQELMGALLTQALLLKAKHASGYLVAFMQQAGSQYEVMRYSLQPESTKAR